MQKNPSEWGLDSRECTRKATQPNKKSVKTAKQVNTQISTVAEIARAAYKENPGQFHDGEFSWREVWNSFTTRNTQGTPQNEEWQRATTQGHINKLKKIAESLKKETPISLMESEKTTNIYPVLPLDSENVDRCPPYAPEAPPDLTVLPIFEISKDSLQALKEETDIEELKKRLDNMMIGAEAQEKARKENPQTSSAFDQGFDR